MPTVHNGGPFYFLLKINNRQNQLPLTISSLTIAHKDLVLTKKYKTRNTILCRILSKIS